MLVTQVDGERKALLMRVRARGDEIPKGHVKPAESPQEVALRELREETGLTSALRCGPEVGVSEYSFDHGGLRVDKRVHYFVAFFAEGETPEYGERHWRTKELHWVSAEELETLPLMHEVLRPMIARALKVTQSDTLRS